jgi:hypothetical protein
MPLEGDAEIVHEYELPTDGVNMSVGRIAITSKESLLTKNIYVRGGLRVREGYSKRIADPIQVGANKVTFLHRFYLQDGTSQLLAGGGTLYVRQNGTAWTTIASGKTDDAPVCVSTWGALDKCYFADGTLAGATWDGTTFTSSITGLSGIVPTQFLAYQDRLLMISKTEPGVLRWSESFDDTVWISAATTGVRPDSVIHGMMIHATNQTQEQGQNAMVLLAGNHGMYLFAGTNLSINFSNYTIQSIAGAVGCNAPKTMVWTPLGTCYMGIDLQVYLLPFDSIVPIPIGENIRSQIDGYTGIENQTSSNISNARAVYHDGFYKLSITTGTFNDEQWWLDVSSSFRRSLGQSIANRSFSVGWFGPMKGMNFSEMISTTGAGDAGDFIAGEADTAVGAYVYDVSKLHLDDDGTAITYEWRSFFNPLSDKFLNSICHKIEVEALNTIGSVLVSFEDSDNSVSPGSVTISAVGSPATYGSHNYGTVNYGGRAAFRKRFGISPPLNQRFIGLVIIGSATTITEIYSVRISEEQQNEALGQRR